MMKRKDELEALNVVKVGESWQVSYGARGYLGDDRRFCSAGAAFEWCKDLVEKDKRDAVKHDRPVRYKLGNVTLAQVRAVLTPLGVMIRKDEGGDYRVTIKGLTPDRAEAVANYSPDLLDALDSGCQMATYRERELARCRAVR